MRYDLHFVPAGPVVADRAAFERLQEGRDLVETELAKVIAAEPVERKFAKLIKSGELSAMDPDGQLHEAQLKGLLSAEDVATLRELQALVLDAISVDDFDPNDLQSALNESQLSNVAVYAIADGGSAQSAALYAQGGTDPVDFAILAVNTEAAGLLGLAERVRRAIARERPVPILFIGVGEGIDDLRPFVARDFAEALIG